MSKLFSLRTVCSFGVFLLVCFFSTLSLATPAEEAQLEQLDKIERDLELQRDWAKYRWDKANFECYQKYWVNDCLKDSRAQYRKEIDPIRVQEVELHEVQRKLRASIKDQRDAAKIAERASTEKAAERMSNQKEFEEKQKAAAARAADVEQRRKDAPKRAQENKAGTQLD
ncbi:hypothetical protein [Polynucleobacter sp. AP-Elch-400A-B2]|uniref:hypothetical protein n=1 Tax=Polynucleobacter sp. AP-Elch-400A-B2 TaxID=2576930 RepID=UPI001BFE04F8|nr:hypothetical protein [Polynucleobacter sp. AP-Elch-400A-B2]